MKFVIPASLIHFIGIREQNGIKMNAPQLTPYILTCINRQGQAIPLRRNVFFNCVGVELFQPRASACVQCVWV